MSSPPEPPVAAPARRGRVTILTYHRVGRFDPPTADRGVYCNLPFFERQMRFLARLRYRVIPLAEAREGLLGRRRLPPRAVVLTFDDGYRDFYEHALPVLEQHRFPATVFAISGALGRRATWLADTRPELLDGAALREIQSRGIEVGSHTHTHPRLSRLPTSEVAEELRRSKAILEDLLGREVPSFCYPYGDLDARVRGEVAAAGYELACATWRGSARPGADLLALPRQGIGLDKGVLAFAHRLHLSHRLRQRAPALAQEPAPASRSR